MRAACKVWSVVSLGYCAVIVCAFYAQISGHMSFLL